MVRDFAELELFHVDNKHQLVRKGCPFLHNNLLVKELSAGVAGMRRILASMRMGMQELNDVAVGQSSFGFNDRDDDGPSAAM